jgi:hypothetical protein
MPVACISAKKNKGVTLHMLLFVFFCFFKHLSFDQKYFLAAHKTYDRVMTKLARIHSQKTILFVSL